MTYSSPFPYLKLMFSSVQFIVNRSSTKMVRLYLYVTSIAWGVSTLYAPSSYWATINFLAAANSIQLDIIKSFPYLAILYGVLSLWLTLSRFQSYRAHVASALYGAFLFTSGFCLDVAAHIIIGQDGLTPLYAEVSLAGYTFLSCWVATRALIKGYK